MKKNRFKVMGILLLFCLLLSGCSGNWKDYFHTEESLKREAQRALEEKYDEEFVIHDVWVVAQSAFGATCSPKNDRDVVFEVELYKDGSGIYRDEYVQGVVAKQLSEEFQQEFRKLFKGCFVHSTVRYVETDFKNVSEVTIEDYMNKYDVQGSFSFWGMDVFILLSEISQDTIEAEYELFSQKIQEEISEGRLPNIAFDLYFVDDETMKWCKEYFKVNSHCYTEFYNTVEDYGNIGFGYPMKKINKTYEEYKKLRMEITTNG